MGQGVRKSLIWTKKCFDHDLHSNHHGDHDLHSNHHGDHDLHSNHHGDS